MTGQRLVDRTAAGVLGLLVLLVLLSGCGASAAREDLRQCVEDTTAAVRSVGLAVDLLQHRQTSRASTEVTARDMTDQIAKAQQKLADVPGATPELQALRTQTQIAVGTALVAVQQVTDALAAGEDPTAAAATLAAAEQNLQRTAAAVGER